METIITMLLTAVTLYGLGCPCHESKRTLALIKNMSEGVRHVSNCKTRIH